MTDDEVQAARLREQLDQELSVVRATPQARAQMLARLRSAGTPAATSSRPRPMAGGWRGGRRISPISRRAITVPLAAAACVAGVILAGNLLRPGPSAADPAGPRPVTPAATSTVAPPPVARPSVTPAPEGTTAPASPLHTVVTPRRPARPATSARPTEQPSSVPSNRPGPAGTPIATSAPGTPSARPSLLPTTVAPS